MNITKFLLPLLLVAITFQAEAKSCKKKSKNCSKKSETTDIAINKAEFSQNIKASEDFFEYVNEKWIKQNPIPDDKASYDMFTKLDEESKTVVREILDKAASTSNQPKGSNLQLLGDFFRSGMDTTTIDKLGVEPLRSWLTEISNAKTPSQILKTMSRLQLRNISTPIGYSVDADAKNTSRYVMYVSQGGLGLPDKDFYIRTDEKSKKTFEAYKDYVKTIVQLAKLDNAASATQVMQDIIDVEMALASASFSRVELRDPEKNYNLYTIDNLKDAYKNIDWNAYFGEMKVMPKEVVVGQPGFFKAYDSLLLAIPQHKWASYQQFHLINTLSRYLSSNFVNARFNFFGKTLSGIQTMEPRWKRVARTTQDNLRDLVGQEYVKVKFSPVAKQRALALVDNIKASLKERINNLSWMGTETKAKALEKLNKIDVKIGYPDKWYTYENSDVKNQAYVLNVMNCMYGENLRVLERMNKTTIDKTEWYMGPHEVNAYYNPLFNEIVFPAAILQPPYFYEKADDAINYGGIGMVIGHEITHGFDDQGCMFDADGNMKNWWTEEDKKNYDALKNKFVEQYNAYFPFKGDSLHVNGELTLGENIADLGGMIISFNAMKKAAGENAPLINGMTPAQRFFTNYAIIWRNNMRPEAMRMQVLSNEHSPGKYRVNGVVCNLPQFHEAFDVKEGDLMYNKEEDRAEMW